MNVEIGTEAKQFPEKEYMNGIFLAVLINKIAGWKKASKSIMTTFEYCSNRFFKYRVVMAGARRERELLSKELYRRAGLRQGVTSFSSHFKGTAQ